MKSAGAVWLASRPLFALLLLVTLSGCGEARPPATLADGPRVISLSPAVSALMLSIGARDLLVGVDRYSREQAELAGLPSLGGLFAPDIERAFELRPTLVLGVRSEQQRAFFEALRARGVRCEEIDTSGRLEAVLGSFVRVGELIGRRAAAEALVARVHAELKTIAREIEGLPRPRTVLVLDVDPLYVAGGGGFVHDLIEIAGGINIFGELAAAYPRVSLEVLAARAPDVIVDTSLDADDPAALAAARERWARFDWAKRIAFLPRGIATLPGPELAQGAALIREQLHPRSQAPGP